MKEIQEFPKSLNLILMMLEDDEDYRQIFMDLFKEHDIDYRLFVKRDDFSDNVNEGVSMVVVDHYLDDFKKTGLDVVCEIKQKWPWVFCIAFTAQANMDVAVEYLNAGCNRYVDKRKPDYLKTLVKYVKEGIAVAKLTFDLVNYAKKEIERENEWTLTLQELEK